MSELVTDEKACGKVREVFDEIREIFGMVPNFFRALAAADAEWLSSSWNRWKEVMGHDRHLDKKTKEFIAMAVSIVNRCEYCQKAHENAARSIGATDDEIIELKRVIDLFSSFTSIADSLEVPLDKTLLEV